MKQTAPSSLKNFPSKWLLPIFGFQLSVIITILSSIILFQRHIEMSISTAIISLGLDPVRTQLITTLLLTAATATISAALTRKKAGAFIGGGIVFCFFYLIPFVQTQLKPIYDPGGQREPLNSVRLVQTSIILLALGLLSTLIGIGVGQIFGETVCSQPYRALYALYQHLILKLRKKPADSEQQHATNKITARHSATSPWRLDGWLLTFGVIAMILLAIHSSDLFLFSPDVGIHTQPRFTDSQGRNIVGTVIQSTLISPALNGQRRPFLVYLPPSYKTPQGLHMRYPVLYLLHGTPGKDIDWITGGKADEAADSLIATKKIPELIMVFPDGNGRAGTTSEWGNSADRKQMMENFLVNDLVKYVDQHFRTIANPAHRAIGGLSEGGFGAMNIAIHHPNLFDSVISLGGYYRAEGLIWGANQTYHKLNSPMFTLPATEQAWKLHMFLGAATKDQPYYHDTQLFMAELAKLHITYHFDLQQGYHSWHVWQRQIYDALKWLHWDMTNGTKKPIPLPQTKLPKLA
ncbi:MAG TPA: alpha/beta hydrolase-fold protein [Dictyobacter sp.]|jgi:enterochelin esterase-like enzyme|nr:alpha/beta hydrolase-fold protein [Dictyobacter sp.]